MKVYIVRWLDWETEKPLRAYLSEVKANEYAAELNLPASGRHDVVELPLDETKATCIAL